MDEGEHPDGSLEAAEAARAEAEASDEAKTSVPSGPVGAFARTTFLLDGPAVCPFLQLERGDDILPPLDRVDPDHRCGALAPPVEVSDRQQALVCLVAAHAVCPRYLRGEHIVPVVAATSRRGPIPRTTVAAAGVLAASILATLAYTASSGGLVVPVLATPSPSGSASGSPAASPMPTAAPSAVPSPAPSGLGSVAPAPSPSPAGSPSPAASVAITTPGPSATSDRYALLVPCQDRPACYIYTVRAGDNLTSIGLYFGVPFDTILRLNTWIHDPTTIHAGDRIVLPPPTR